MRLFIGIPLEERVKSDIINLQAKFKAMGKIKWVDRENLHVTVKFLGETFESSIESIKSVLDKSVTGKETFDITINKVLAFPSVKKAKIIWANVDKNSEIIKMLFEDIENSLVKAGFAKEEREYTPHITMARVKDGIDISNMVQNMDFEFMCKITGILLYKSELRTQGAIYIKLYEGNLI